MPNQPTNKQLQRERRKIERRIKSIEEQIVEHEQVIEEHEPKLYEPDYVNDYTKLQEINQTIKENEEAIEALMEEWGELQEELESLD